MTFILRLQANHAQAYWIAFVLKATPFRTTSRQPESRIAAWAGTPFPLDPFGTFAAQAIAAVAACRLKVALVIAKIDRLVRNAAFLMGLIDSSVDVLFG